MGSAAKERLVITEVPENGRQYGVLSPEAKTVLQAHVGEYVQVLSSTITIRDVNDPTTVENDTFRGKLIAVGDKSLSLRATEGSVTIDGKQVPFTPGERELPYSMYELVEGDFGHTTISTINEIAVGGLVFEFEKAAEKTFSPTTERVSKLIDDYISEEKALGRVGITAAGREIEEMGLAETQAEIREIIVALDSDGIAMFLEDLERREEEARLSPHARFMAQLERGRELVRPEPSMQEWNDREADSLARDFGDEPSDPEAIRAIAAVREFLKTLL